MPDTASLSYYQKVNDKWDFLADVTWTGWSSIQELRIMRTDGSALPVLPENFKDTWRYSAGVNYYYDDKTVLRAGVAYDQSPVNNIDRGPRLPDNDRTWLTIGGRYKYSSALNFDVGAGYIFVKDGSINNSRAIRPALPPTGSSTARTTTTSSSCPASSTTGGDRSRVGRPGDSISLAATIGLPVPRAARFSLARRRAHRRASRRFHQEDRMMRKLLIVGIATLFAATAFAADVGGVKLADKVTVGGQELVLNGAGDSHPRHFQGLRRQPLPAGQGGRSRRRAGEGPAAHPDEPAARPHRRPAASTR